MLKKANHAAAYRHRKQVQGICIFGGCWDRAMNARVFCSFHSSSRNRKKKRRKR